MAELKDLIWYHGNITRHISEALLMANGTEGSYLLRDGAESNELCISVRGRDSVRHFKILKEDGIFKFGVTEFTTLDALINHFANQPLLGGVSGTLVLLKYPYPKVVEEPDNYDSIVLQSTARTGATEKDLAFQTKADSLASKEGFLTKQGFYVKNWKVRWFVLTKNELSYYADQTKDKPIKSLDLTDCQGCYTSEVPGKDYCFCLEFPDRKWFFQASTEEEQNDWVKMIKFKIKQIRKGNVGF